MIDDMFDVNELVKVYLKPPYLTTKTGIPTLPSSCIVTIYVRGELYQEYYATNHNKAPAALNMFLFNIRALARNKGAKCEAYIEVAEMTPDYEWAFNNKDQSLLDVTERFPHPTYAY